MSAESNNLLDSYGKIGSDGVTNRAEGLKELRRILSKRQNVKDLSDKGYHRMFEILFRAAIKEKSLYLKERKKSGRTRATVVDRLALCGQVLRLAVEAGVEHLRTKTIKALCTHIVDLLRMPDGGLCEPLSLDYLRTLRACLQYGPHTEHLSKEEWVDIARFCCENLETQLGLDLENVDGYRSEREVSLSRENSFASRRSGATSQQASRLNYDSEELVVCLRALLSASNAPVLDYVMPICDVLLGFLASQRTVTRAHQATFAALNSVLDTVTTNRLTLAAHISETILPVISHLWSTKSPGVKEEMLATLIYCQPHIRARIQAPEARPFRRKVEALFDTIYGDYATRSDRDMLQLDDVDFPDPLKAPHKEYFPLSLRTLCLRTTVNGFRSEQLWMVPSLIAMLMELLDRSSDRTRVPKEDGETCVKRQRIYNRFDDLMRSIRSDSANRKLCSIQVLSFLAANGGVNEEEFSSIVHTVHEACSDDSPAISSWALLALASCAYLKPAADPSHAALWKRTWQLCARHVTGQQTCRAACHVMRVILSLQLLNYAHISQEVDAMILSVDLSGPAIPVDSALALWILILQKRNSVVRSSRVHPGERLFQWFISKWHPDEALHKVNAPFYSHHTSPTNVLNFLCACCGLPPLDVDPYPRRICGSVAQANIRTTRYTDLLAFLLHEEQYEESTGGHDLGADTADFGSRNSGLEDQVREFFDKQADAVREEWRRITSAQVQHITADVVYNFVGFLSTASMVHAAIGPDGSLNAKLRDLLFVDLTGYLRRVDCNQQLIDGLLICVGEVLPQPRQLVLDTLPANFEGPNSGLLCIISRLSQALDEKKRTSESMDTEGEEDDHMDLDDDFGMSDRRREEEKSDRELLREELQVSCSEVAFRKCTTTHLALVAALLESQKPVEICARFVEYLKGMNRADLLMAGSLIRDFLEAAAERLGDEDAFDLIETLATRMLQGYAFERCETSIGICIFAIQALVKRWISDGGVLSEPCAQVYDHLAKVALDKRITSYTLRLSMARLLRSILSGNPEYGHRSAQYPPISMFLPLLKDEDVRVLYCMAHQLPLLLKSAASAVWLNKYADIEDHLPQSEEWTEGLALRVYTLGLLPQCSLSYIWRVIYRIFETAEVESGEKYASRALLLAAKALRLSNQRDLFRIFRPQLLYLWLENHQLNRFPFRAFGYASLEELCRDSQEELVAQMVSRGADDACDDLATFLGSTYEQLVKKAFARIVAYGTCSASTIRPTEDGSLRPTTELRLRKRLGDDTYTELLHSSFPLVISCLFQLMQDDGLGKLLSTDPNLRDVHANMLDITTHGQSSTKADYLRPFYKVRHILSAVNHLCGTLDVQSFRLWNAGMFTFVVRHLFNDMHPARGPPLNLGVIRKIRFLICLAGPVAKSGYPLEMLIHGLKPYIVDEKCAQDTIAIVKYLFIHGEAYLTTRPTFVIGSFLSTVATLRAYLYCSPEQDGTEASRNSEVRSIVHKFDEWLVDHLVRFAFDKMSEEQHARFQSIIRSAKGFRQYGNAQRETQESDLLRHLLDDDVSTDCLLDDVSRQRAFQLLSSNFKRPSSFRDDMFGADEESMARSNSLLGICRRFNVSDGFLHWSARVLGRSYAASGRLHTKWTQEIEFEHPADLINYALDVTPKAGILRSIRRLLLAEDQRYVGLAESCLRHILQEEEVEDDGSFNQVLTKDECSAFLLEYPMNGAKKQPSPRPIMGVGKAHQLPVDTWIRELTVSIATNLPEDPIVSNLQPLLETIPGLPEELFQYVLHILLVDGLYSQNERLRTDLSKLFQDCLQECTEETAQHNRILIESILYLRTQPIAEKEATNSDRDQWLSVDFLSLSRAACTCKMYKTALLFVEIYASKSTVDEDTIPSDLLLEIFKNVEDPDYYYGVNQDSGLQAVLNRFEYEGDGWKSLSFRGANLESLKRVGAGSEEEDTGVVNALNTLSMNGLSRSFLEGSTVSTGSEATLDNMFRSAWKLEQWDLPCPASCKSHSAIIYRALQSVNNTIDNRPIASYFDAPFLDVMRQLTVGRQTGRSLAEGMVALSMMVETEEALASGDAVQLEETWDRMRKRESWMITGRYSDVGEIMAMRQATFGTLAKREHLRAAMKVDIRMAKLLEAKTLVGSCKMARNHKKMQHALSVATHLEKLVSPCNANRVDINAVSTLQSANVLWELGEGVASIRMLQNLGADPEGLSQAMVVGRAKLLAKLGRWVSEARLEKPERILSTYLEKAIEQLDRDEIGSDAGRVYHEFAYFCDQQLQDPSATEEYQRALKLRQNKEAEVRELQKIVGRSAENKKNYSRPLLTANKWLELDDMEFTRLKENRDTFLEKAVLNYLRCLGACDDHDGDAVRFCALWLAHSSDPKVNAPVVAQVLSRVPSRKFVPMMNQLSSRLSDTEEAFQGLLKPLIIRICTDHPHHGIYQILALHRLKPTSTDTQSQLRQLAARKVFETLQRQRMKNVTIALYKSTSAYNRLARVEFDKQLRKAGKISLAKACALDGSKTDDLSKLFTQEIINFGIPPPTMHIEVRADCNYSQLPRLIKFDPELTIASGLSAPAIIKCRASDGKTYRLLLKGGNDDLRQDAIMEQVFAQVSTLLQRNRATRQRNLSIRTYKVIPLTSTTGIIEFVPNTLPLHDFIIPAHHRYHPQDWNQSKCREEISNAAGKSREDRLKVYRSVASHFTPVLHYFFMHRFSSPDEWFSSRLAYTRSTAANSILGWVLGLGDRHGHNILLDEKSGEVVHIDLGVAFEQGRVLPIPEVVPFRLTRDIVDGMGVTKTEGVFRRCCEFTLTVLRNESYSIITILDVLRYDPLYSWTISPLRREKMQKNQLDPQSNVRGAGPVVTANDESEGEADRALTVVSKKLSKNLSDGATVNELIQQASDEKNLSVLFAGWAAYA